MIRRSTTYRKVDCWKLIFESIHTLISEHFLGVCMYYVCMYTYVYTCMYIYTYISHGTMCVCLSLCVCVCVCVHIYIYTYIYIYIYIYTHIYTYVYIYDICIYIYMYIHIYICIYEPPGSWGSARATGKGGAEAPPASHAPLVCPYLRSAKRVIKMSAYVGIYGNAGITCSLRQS
jgi:hypothetical protein